MSATVRVVRSARSIAIVHSPATASWADSPLPTSRRRDSRRAAGSGASLREYLATGASALAVASDEMLKVVNLSTSRLNAGDLDAMTIYLLGDAPPAPATLAGVAASADAAAQRHYFDLCAGCHGRDGGGVPNVAVSLRANSSVRDPNPHNLIVAILDGLPEHDFPGLARMQDMPGFAADLDDAEVAALATWLRQQFGGQSAPVEAASVRELRR